MVLQRPHEEKHLSRSGFTDCGWRNVSTPIPVDSDTPDQSSDSAPSFAPANRTSPGYTEGGTDRETAGDVSGCFGDIKQEEGICLMKLSSDTSLSLHAKQTRAARCDIISGAGGRLPGRWLCVSSGVHRIQEADWMPSSSSWGWWRSLTLQPENNIRQFSLDDHKPFIRSQSNILRMKTFDGSSWKNWEDLMLFLSMIWINWIYL